MKYSHHCTAAVNWKCGGGLPFGEGEGLGWQVTINHVPVGLATVSFQLNTVKAPRKKVATV